MALFLETANGNVRVPATAYNVTGNLIDVRRPKRQKGDDLIPISVKQPFKPHSGQKPIWYDRKTRNQILLAGSQGGKSHCGPPWLWREIERTIEEGGRIEGKEYLFGIVAPSLRLQRQATVGIARMVRFLCAKFDCSEDLILNKQDLKIDLRPLKKSHNLDYPIQIHAGSAERIHSLQGARLEAAWIDEGGNVKEAAIYHVTKQRLYGRGRLLVTTTPYIASAQWLKEIIDRVAAGEEPDTTVVRFPSIVNPYFSLESETNLRNELPKWYFNMMYNARFEQPHGLVYPDVTYVEPFAIPRHWPRIIGMDPTHGGPDEFAAVWIAYDPFDPEFWYIYREFYLPCTPKITAHDQTHYQPYEMLDIIRDLSFIEVEEDGVLIKTDRRENIGRIFVDPNAPWVRVDLESRFPESQIFKADTKLDGLVDVGRKLKTGQLRVFNNLKDWAFEQTNYIYPYSQFGEAVGPDPIDRNNHLLDSTRYCVRQSDEARNLAEPSFA